jgi:hypothetical protein
MKKAFSVARTYGNLPAYTFLKISDYSHAEASCRNKHKLLTKRRQRLDNDEDKENSRVVMHAFAFATEKGEGTSMQCGNWFPFRHKSNY